MTALIAPAEAPPAEAPPADAPPAPRPGRRRPGFARRFARHKGAVLGLGLLLAVVAVALLAGVIAPSSPWRLVGRPFVAPFANERFPLGTDALGRDLLAGLVHGARASLLVGLVSTAVALLIGVPLGAVAGYAGGWVDWALMRVTEFFQTIPSFALAVVLVAVLQPSLASIIGAIAVVSWPPVARLVRGEVLSLRSREYVLAAVAAGQSPARVLLTQALPNAVAPIVVMASLMVASAVLLEASLAFLGLNDPNQMSWGLMVGAGRARLIDAPWISVMPGLCVLLTVLALNLVGEGLGDALNPRRGEGG